MSNYNLSDNVNDTFEFNIRGKKFTMRYPRTEEIDTVQELNTKLEEAQAEKRVDDVKAVSKELEQFLYNFITPVEHQETIQDVLAKENIKVMNNFNKMIKAELSLN